MDKIKINLLPPEIKEKEKKAAKRSLINKISIFLLGVLILVTSSILAVVIFQGSRVNMLNADLQNEETQIQGLKEEEAIVKLLKNRLDTINQFANKKYHQREIYDLITSLFPQGVSLRTLQVDKSNKIVVIGQTDNTTSLQAFFNALTDPEKTEGKVASVTIENLTKNQTGQINFELNVALKNGVI